MAPKKCPSCDICLEDIDIYEYFLKECGDENKALEDSSCYGWTKANPTCFSRCIGIYDIKEDRTVRWLCPDCKHEWNR